MSRIHEALKKAEQERAASQASLAPIGAPTTGAPIITGNEASPAVAIGTLAAEAPFPPLARSFGSPAEIDSPLARCPQVQWNPDERTMLFFNGSEASRGAEEFRTLRSRLYHSREKMLLKKVLVTSALPKEGKSFTAANLAQVLARQHGRRVLLIDADLRGPRLHTMLGAAASPGLSDFIKGAVDEFSIMQRGPMENLFFVPAGGELSNPAELVASERLKLFMQRVENLFDWVIIDSPPAVPVSDASVLAKLCEGVVIVVRSNATPMDAARRVREEFPDQLLVGVVLNGIEHQPNGYLQYYDETYNQKTTES